MKVRLSDGLDYETSGILSIKPLEDGAVVVRYLSGERVVIQGVAHEEVMFKLKGPR